MPKKTEIAEDTFSDKEVAPFFDLEFTNKPVTAKDIEKFVNNLTIGLTRWDRLSKDDKRKIKNTAHGLVDSLREVYSHDDTGKKLNKQLMSDEAIGTALIVAAALFIMPKLEGAQETLVRSLARNRILKATKRKR